MNQERNISKRAWDSATGANQRKFYNNLNENQKKQYRAARRRTALGFGALGLVIGGGAVGGLCVYRGSNKDETTPDSAEKDKVETIYEAPTTPESVNIGHIYTDGTRIFKPNGEELTIRAVAKPSLEWGNGEYMESPEIAGYPLLADWGINAIRLPLNQKHWLEDQDYRNEVDKQVDWIEAEGMYAILDLHHTPGGDEQTEIERMPDQGSVEFWRQVAEEYKNDPNVIFELYNEPHESINVWLEGGDLPPTDQKPAFYAVGMQQLYDIIRNEVGAENLIIVNGDEWGWNHMNLPQIEGENIVYGIHPYGQHPGKNTVDDVRRMVDFLHDRGNAVMITEFGDTTTCEGDFYEEVIKYAEENQIGWSAWAWYPDDPSDGCGFPGLVRGFENGKWQLNPNGETIKRVLHEVKN